MTAPLVVLGVVVVVIVLLSVVGFYVFAGLIATDGDPEQTAPPTTVTTAPPDDGPAALDGTGPTSEPTPTWATSLPAWDGMVLDVAADGERVYVVRYLDGGDVGIALVTAHSAVDGTELWRHELFYPWDGETMVVPMGHDQVLVIGEDLGQYTELLDARTGDLVWRVDGSPSYFYSQIGGDGAIVDLATADTILLEVDEDTSPIGTAAVDRATGAILWRTEEDAVSPCGDVAVTTTWDYSTDDLPPVVTSTGRDARSGEVLWTDEVGIDSCNAEVGTTGDGPSDVIVRDIVTGEATATITVPGTPADGTWYAEHSETHLLASAYVPGTERQQTRTVALPLAGGDPVFDEVGPSAFGLTPARAFLRSGDEITLLRLPEGVEAGRAQAGRIGSSCPGAITATVVVGCTYDDPVVVSWSLGATLEERWRVDVGPPVARIAIGGATLFVVTTDGELLAFG